MKPNENSALRILPKNKYLEYIKLFPVTQTQQVKTYTTLILTLVAVIGFSLFAISPTVNTILELRKQLADSQFADAALQEKISALQSLQEQYISLGTDLARISMAVPTTPEVPELLAKVQTLADAADLHIAKLEALQVELTKKSGGGQAPSSFVFVITTTGSYEQLLRFLDSLKSFDRLITIEAIAVERTGQGSIPLTASIRARAYFHPETL
jgi:Tfp pilus assembly protein PilO